MMQCGRRIILGRLVMHIALPRQCANPERYSDHLAKRLARHAVL